MEKKKHYMFAYGMNTNIDSMAVRCPSSVVVGTGVLENFRLDFRYHADVTYKRNHKTHGLVWEMSSAAMTMMDKFEGRPFYYGRIIQPVMVSGVTYDAWVYVMKNKDYTELPSDSYWESLMDGYEQNNIPTKQLIDAIQRVTPKVENNV